MNARNPPRCWRCWSLLVEDEGWDCPSCEAVGEREASREKVAHFRTGPYISVDPALRDALPTVHAIQGHLSRNEGYYSLPRDRMLRRLRWQRLLLLREVDDHLAESQIVLVDREIRRLAVLGGIT